MEDISTFKLSIEKSKTYSEPVIKNLRIIEPDEYLLKQLAIKDESDSRYLDSPTDSNYQVLGGEAEVNGVTFPLYIVITKGRMVFSDQVKENSNIPADDVGFHLSVDSPAVEKFIKDNLEALSKVDTEILKIIKDFVEPIIVFKSTQAYDYLANANWGAYVTEPGEDGFIGTRNINFFGPAQPCIVHEFGHLFDFALGIVSESINSDWKQLAKKYSSSLKLTTTCGIALSNYSKEDYEAMAREFFADLFYAYYLGDQDTDGKYLIEKLDKEALEALEMEIGDAIKSQIEDEVNESYLSLSSDIEQIVNYYSNKDIELSKLTKKFLETTDAKVLGLIDGEQVNDINVYMYHFVSSMMKLLIKLHKQYLSNPIEENRELIKGALLSFFSDISKLSTMDIDYISSNQLNMLINREQSIDDETIYVINYIKATKKLYELLNIIYSSNYQFPSECIRDSLESIRNIKDKINNLTSNGLSDNNYRIILSDLKKLMRFLYTFNPSVVRTRIF